MKLQKRPTEPVEYTLKEHEALESPPVFTLKPLSVGLYDKVHNLIAAQQQGSALRICCVHGIKGWTEIEPEFDTDKVADLIGDYFTLEWTTELGNKVFEISSVPEQEKNS